MRLQSTHNRTYPHTHTHTHTVLLTSMNAAFFRLSVFLFPLFPSQNDQYRHTHTYSNTMYAFVHFYICFQTQLYDFFSIFKGFDLLREEYFAKVLIFEVFCTSSVNYQASPFHVLPMFIGVNGLVMQNNENSEKLMNANRTYR